MVNTLKLLRSGIVGNRPAGGAQPYGVPYVNFADKQFGAFDISQNPQDLIGVPFFSTTANYSAGQPVNYQGQLYVARGTVTAGAWNSASWSPVVTAANSVRTDVAQSLTAAQQTQARQNVYAAPLDALAYNGMQVNGAVEVNQFLAAVTGPVTDGWTSNAFAAGGAIVHFSTARNAGFFPGIPSFLYSSLTTAQAVVGNNDYAIVTHPIEGYRLARLQWGTVNAQPITIGWWSNHHPAGTYSITVRNPDGSRSYAMTYTHASADVPQFNTITVPGCLDGTWPITNAAGMLVDFAIATGASQTAPSTGAWLAGNYIGAPGQINGFASTANTVRITGLIVLPGIEAPSAARAPFIMRPYDQELPTCQRYYETLTFGNTLAQLVNSYAMMGTSFNYSPRWTFSVQKRAIPTISLGAGASWSGVTPTSTDVSVDGVMFNHAANSFYVAGTAGAVGLIADARL